MRETRRRSDAVRNHERVIAAARELFTEQGLGVTVPQVAERAGVGKATVYRSYPTKQELVVAVAREQFRRLASDTEAALARDDAYEALCSYVPGMFAALAADRVLADALFDGEILPAAVILAQVGELLRRAARDGPIRPDAGETDVRVVLCGAVRQLIVLGETDPAVWRRYAEMVLNAFRLSPTGPLPR
ncbi:putative transcriptional regulator, TetR family protein [Paractinoplanes deccanensis]|uniref:Transcriptional regulator, TetR family protein n=1 Tax=Paractinoplanes deccanensis TaxID=113561 RepID=A0ABQ3YAI0_9ACTN|nr:TetR/AcrR family transcriptional regulator [Actinoplanes deccanensis]GID77008.1 putative transcriptional regulator, TetR family protein [Actinoplanes deccanensis]